MGAAPKSFRRDDMRGRNLSYWKSAVERRIRKDGRTERAPDSPKKRRKHDEYESESFFACCDNNGSIFFYDIESCAFKDNPILTVLGVAWRLREGLLTRENESPYETFTGRPRDRHLYKSLLTIGE